MSRSLTRTLILILLVIVAGQLYAVTLPREKLRLLSKRPKVAEIVIEGNHSFSAGKIKSKMYTKEDGFWQSIGLMRANRFGKLNLNRDELLLEYFYRTQGFDDADVSIDFEPVKGNEEEVRIIVHIDEGIRYRVGDVEITGNLGAQGYQATQAINPMRKAKYFNGYLLEQTRQDIKTVYANNGYPYAKIETFKTKNPADSTIDVEYRVARNQLVLFGPLHIDSTLTTKREVFKREMAFKRGDIYRREKFIESQERLIRTNLFNFVSLNTPDTMSTLDSLMPPFYVTAVERPPRYINVGIGAAQAKEANVSWNTSATLGSRNIKGTARKVSFSTSAILTYQDSLVVRPQFEFDYTEPYLLRQRLPLIVTFKFQPLAPSLVQSYNIRTISIDATAIREFSLITRLSASLNYEEVNISVDGSTLTPADLEQLRKEEGISVDRRFILQLERDTRPILSRFNPASGSYTLYRGEYVGGILGGDDDFVKLLWSWSRYKRLGTNSVFATRLRFGWVHEFGKSTDVPSRERFYLGGAYTIRGFPENEFGPKSPDGSTIGGKVIGLLNLEVRKPIVYNFWGSIFTDAGFNELGFAALKFKSPAVTTGFGLEYMSPVGPLRIDYGQRTSINGYKSGGQFHFGILYAF